MKRLVQKRKIITQEESLYPQENAAKKRKIKESDQLKREGAASQLQEEGNNRNEPPKVDKTGTKTSGSNSILESKEEITTICSSQPTLHIIVIATPLPLLKRIIVVVPH